MPTEKVWSITSKAPTHTIATRSSPKTSLWPTLNIKSSRRVATVAFIVSTARFMNRAWRSSWRLKSLIDCTPRNDSRK